MMSALDHYSGEQLLILIKQGDRSAYTIFCEKYWDYLLLLAFRRLRNVDEAKDVVQEVFIWIWVKRSTINISGEVKGYLCGAVINKTADLMRANARRRGHYEQYVHLKEEVVDRDVLEEKELGKEISLAIEMVAPASREAFEKRFMEDKSLKEIAGEMGINLQSVKNHIQRALKALRKRL